MRLSKSENEKYWYAIFTKTRAEKKAYQRMLDNNIDAFLPLVKTVRQWSDRKKTLYVPLISSYVFVNMLEKDLHTTLPIQGTVNILKYLGKPAKIKITEIENLKILSNSEEDYRIEVEMSVIKGDVVEVTKGPFMGLIATCENSSGSHRVIVNIESLGSSFIVNVPLSHLRIIENRTIA